MFGIFGFLRRKGAEAELRHQEKMAKYQLQLEKFKVQVEREKLKTAKERAGLNSDKVKNDREMENLEHTSDKLENLTDLQAFIDEHSTKGTPTWIQQLFELAKTPMAKTFLEGRGLSETKSYIKETPPNYSTEEIEQKTLR